MFHSYSPNILGKTTIFTNKGLNVRKARIGITAEGVPSIALSALAALIFAILGCAVMAVVFLLLTFFCCNFFRDPERVTPQTEGLAVSPADGKIVKIAEMPDPFTGEPRRCICIFMNVFNVHVNRMPVSGTIEDILYHPGLFLNASLDKASKDNERCSYLVKDKEDNAWCMVQIAGLVARRIVSRVDIGDTLERGDRFGMIKFGSRVDVYLPQGYSPSVRLGEKVLAGQSVIAKKD